MTSCNKIYAMAFEIFEKYIVCKTIVLSVYFLLNILGDILVSNFLDMNTALRIRTHFLRSLQITNQVIVTTKIRNLQVKLAILQHAKHTVPIPYVIYF